MPWVNNTGSASTYTVRFSTFDTQSATFNLRLDEPPINLNAFRHFGGISFMEYVLKPIYASPWTMGTPLWLGLLCQLSDSEAREVEAPTYRRLAIDYTAWEYANRKIRSADRLVFGHSGEFAWGQVNFLAAFDAEFCGQPQFGCPLARMVSLPVGREIQLQPGGVTIDVDLEPEDGLTFQTYGQSIFYNPNDNMRIGQVPPNEFGDNTLPNNRVTVGQATQHLREMWAAQPPVNVPGARRHG